MAPKFKVARVILRKEKLETSEFMDENYNTKL